MARVIFEPFKRTHMSTNNSTTVKVLEMDRKITLDQCRRAVTSY